MNLFHKISLRYFSLFVVTSLVLVHNSHAQIQNSESIKILFIGNSYTSAHNIPKIISDLAKADGVNIEVDMVTPGGATFQSHLSNQSIPAKLSEKKWNYVVLQEQSQKMAFSDMQVQSDSFAPAKKLVSLIHGNARDAKVIFYNTWGRKNGDQDNCKIMREICTYDGMQSRIDKNYRAIALETKSLLFPAGKIWRKIKTNYPNIELYEADGSHPSQAGAYLVAYSFYKILSYSKSSANLDVTNLDKNTAQLIRNAVDRVLLEK